MSETQIEVWLASLFAEVGLGVNVDRDEDFIRLGGDSLSAMLCISRIRAEFGVELSVEDFFLGNSSMRHLSKTVEQMQDERSPDPGVVADTKR